MKKIFKCILFDLDGTLIQSGPDLLDSLNFILEKNKIPQISSNTIGNLVGGGAANMIEKAYKFNNIKIKPKEIIDLVDQFISYYSKNCSNKTLPYKNVLPTLKTLKSKEILMCVCTNKKQYLAEKILKDLNLFKYFEIILGSNPSLKMKPDCEMLVSIINELGVDIKNTIMVGDSDNDIIPANKLGINSVFATYGYGEIGNLSPTAKIRDFSEILEFIKF